MSDPRSRPDQPDFWRDLAALVAGGGLRGEAAEDAIVDLITASEVGPDDHPRFRVEVREQVEDVVRGDPVLRALLHEAPLPEPVAEPVRERPHHEPPGPTPAPFEDVLEPARVEPLGERVVEPRRRPQRASRPKRVSVDPATPPRSVERPRRERGRTRPRRVEADGVDAFAAGQTRRRLLALVAVLGAGVASFAAWDLLREKPCERLVRKICLALDECEPKVVRTALREREVGDPLCDATRTAIDEALVGVDPAKSVAVFTRVMKEQLGFDPRGDKASAAAAPASRRSEPTTVADEVGTLIDLFADDAHLLWTRQRPPGVYRVRSIGGSVEVLAEHPDAIDVVATRDFVYWVSRGASGGTLWTDKKRGEYEPMAIELEGFSPVRAAFMGPELAFVDADTGAIVMAAVAGGEPRPIAQSGMPPAVEITADATHVFWATNDGIVSSVPRDGGQTQLLADRQHAPASLATDSTHLYWIDRGRGCLSRVPKRGGTLENLVDDRPGLWDLALDEERVYATDHDGGVVLSVAKSDGATAVVAEGLSHPTQVVVDGAAVYWEAAGVIQRLPK